ncbi:nitrate- and nitrite sensing domain-containing protein [Kitasatospora sp. NPDC101183]|uniref:nitrate- and nitrite sensing domain-containing protein n=1 Tax=Kitasatospora sp. NPDC101183 TaxID=3364100 RepID=UPI00382E4C35
MWAVTSGETVFDFQRQAAQGLLAQKAGQPSNIVYYNLQEERRLTAEALARPGGDTGPLTRQRKATDEAVRRFQSLSGETADSAPSEVRGAVAEARQAMNRLPEQRAAVDHGSVDQQAVYTYYTDLIAVDLRLFTALSHVDNGEVTWISKTLVNTFWAKEMLAREDAILARGWPSGRLGAADLQQVQLAIGAGDHLYTGQVLPYLPEAEAGAWRDLMAGPAWQAKASIEQQLTRPVAADASGSVRLPAVQDQWRQAVDQLNPQLVKAMEARTQAVVEVGKGSITDLLVKVVLTAVVGLVAVVAVVVASWRISRSLRRRVEGLHGQAEEMRRTLPEAVERLGRGERLDAEAASPAVEAEGRGDELDRLGQALNLARSSALAAAVRQAEQHRGFERLLQRIARRTQLLIGRQLRKLDELERRHEDPEVLEGLFDLDHLTARLRRYEENLVIIAGGQPQRRWRKPVPLLDVLRSAQGEVPDYRRIMIEVEGHPWLSERAVGPVAHVLAELMENATTFSKPPTPVEVRAAMVGRGLAIEIEDRGLGMDPDQYDAANRLMASPPRTDVLSRADDIRLGFHVIARLSAHSGLRIEFRPSSFGGTRVVVLVPPELVIDGDTGLPEDAAPVEPIPLVRQSRRAVLGASAPAPEDVVDVSDVVEVEVCAPAVAPVEVYRQLIADGITVPAPADLGHAEAGQDGQNGEPGQTGQTGEQPIQHSSPVYPDIAYARITSAEAPYADEQYRPADHYRLAERRSREYAPTEPPQPTPVMGGQKPLPQRVRQASLAAELRVPPPSQQWIDPEAEAEPAGAPAAPPEPHPVRRSGAAIGAFQRQSRAARARGGSSPASPVPPAFFPASPAEAPSSAATTPTTAGPRPIRTDEQS